MTHVMQPATVLAPDSSDDHSSDPLLQTDLTAPIEASIENIRTLGIEQLHEYVQELIPNDRIPSSAFMDALSPSETADALLACLLVWTLSHGAEVPREFQITAALAAISGQDTVLKAGTGSGKTLAMAIPMLLRPTSMAIVVSPLKRLQSSQVSHGAGMHIVTY
jgi:ATP-dependent helicase YprA (DUF1998 family)